MKGKEADFLNINFIGDWFSLYILLLIPSCGENPPYLGV